MTISSAADRSAPERTGGHGGLRRSLAIGAGRAAAATLKQLGRPASAGPGIVADRVDPTLLRDALAGPRSGLVLVSGSSGKSTTTKMLVAILRAHGVRVFTNASTANLRQGLVSAIVESADLTGAVDADLAVIEIDEAAATRIGAELTPRLTVLTNVSSDQLDRFHSVGVVEEHLRRLAERSGHVVVNRDDAATARIGAGIDVPTSWYGTAGEAAAALRGHMGYAAESPLEEAGWEGTLGGTRVERTEGVRARLRRAGTTYALPMPARGPHYAIDAAAAIEAAAQLLGAAFDPAAVERAFTTLDPVFGRGEVVHLAGETVEFVLVQNIASFRLNIESLAPDPGRLMVAIGDDVRDPSWLWAVDTARMPRVDLVSGSRAYAMASRLDFDGVDVGRVVPDVPDAFERFLDLPSPDADHRTVVHSADAMRRIRRAVPALADASGRAA